MSEGQVLYVRGDDPAVLAQEARGLIARLVGERDPAVVVEEHGAAGGDELDVARLVDAVTTPPFLVDRRVVVLREAGRLSAADAERLAAALEDPPPSVFVVLVASGGTVPQGLVRSVKRLGETHDASVGTGRDRSRWLSEHLRAAPVRLTSGAAGRLGQHLGEDLGRLEGVLDSLAAAYGEGATVDEAALTPFLGEAGSVPPWELTDAIDGGSTEAALAALGRLLGPGGRAAPELVAVLHRHYDQMLQLDGLEMTSPEQAAGHLGVRSTFVAKKALGRTRQLGSERIARAIELIADADLDVKGRSGLPPRVVLEVLVARLSRLGRARR